MKNIFKSILAVVLSALAFTACADYNTVLLSDEMVALNSEKLSFDAIPTAPKTVTVNLDGDWIAVLPVECDWLKVEYLLVAKNGSEYYAGTPVPTSSNYAYLLKKDVTANVQADGSIVMPDGSYGFTFEPTGESGQYIIRQADGEALWQAAAYNNFYTDVTPSEGYIWTVEPQDDGTAIIKSVDLGKWIQYSITYSSYGGYSSAQDNALLPLLYENADKVLDVTPGSVNLTDGDLEEEFTIVCDADLVDAVIPEDCDWITLVSNVSDGVKSTLTFRSSKNPDLASRTASILIGSVDATVNVGVSQPARAITPDDILDKTVADFNAAEVGPMRPMSTTWTVSLTAAQRPVTSSPSSESATSTRPPSR